MGGRIRADAGELWPGRATLLTGLRFCLWCATALWVPVLCAPGDTTAQARAYDTIIWLASWLRLPSLAPYLYPAELLVVALAGGLATFSVIDYWRGSHRPPARIYLATIFWIGLASSYILANPIGYGTWLFAGITFLHWWCLTRVRT